MSTVDYQCHFCKKFFTRSVTWFDPRRFIGKPQMQVTFWCPAEECQLSNTLTVKFARDHVVTVKKVQDTSTVIGQQLVQEPEVTARPKAA